MSILVGLFVGWLVAAAAPGTLSAADLATATVPCAKVATPDPTTPDPTTADPAQSTPPMKAGECKKCHGAGRLP